MKKIKLIFALLFFACTSALAQTQMVTFQVESPDSLPVYVFGSWSGWGNWPGTPMTLVAPNKYTATIAMNANTNHEYLFVNGTAPYAKEGLLPSMPCTNGLTPFTNRVLALGSSDTAVCYTFATCTTCTVVTPPPPPTNVNVTFQVESPDSTPVYVFGSWNWSGWPGTPMTQVAPGKYSATLSLPPNVNHEYLFVNGNAPHAKEVLQPTMPCTNGLTPFTNRVLGLGSNDTSVCYTFATCNTCAVVPPPSNINVKFRVESPDSLPVYVFGSWNWSGWPGTPMTSIGNNIYEATVSLLSNSPYEYLFVNGSTPVKEAVTASMPCTNGLTPFTNRTLGLGFNDTTVCYKWATCNACTPPPSGVNITFQVESPDSTPVYVFGNWNGWNNFPGTPLTLVSGTTYGATVNMPANATYEYLYVNGTGTKEVLNPAWTCTNGNGTFTNRVITVAATDLTKCNKWELCDSCGQVTPSNINVKFAVQATDSTPVFVFGSWSGWSNFPGTPMVLNTATGNYEVTIPMLSNTPVEYLYVNGTGTKEIMNPAGACTNGNTQFTNRVANLGGNDTSFCNIWQTCSACIPLSTNNINMSNVSIVISKNNILISADKLIQFDQVEIFDIVGRKIFATSDKVKTNTNIPVNLDVNNLYIIRVQDGEKYYTIKSMITN